MECIHNFFFFFFILIMSDMFQTASQASTLDYEQMFQTATEGSSSFQDVSDMLSTRAESLESFFYMLEQDTQQAAQKRDTHKREVAGRIAGKQRLFKLYQGTVKSLGMKQVGDLKNDIGNHRITIDQFRRKMFELVRKLRNKKKAQMYTQTAKKDLFFNKQQETRFKTMLSDDSVFPDEFQLQMSKFTKQRQASMKQEEDKKTKTIKRNESVLNFIDTFNSKDVDTIIQLAANKKVTDLKLRSEIEKVLERSTKMCTK